MNIITARYFLGNPVRVENIFFSFVFFITNIVQLFVPRVFSLMIDNEWIWTIYCYWGQFVIFRYKESEKKHADTKLTSSNDARGMIFFQIE